MDGIVPRTDNGKEFTDRLFGARARGSTSKHEFEALTALGIKHRLTPVRRPQTNGMVEHYAYICNQHLLQSVLGSKPPIQAMKDWYAHPHLFKRRPYNRQGRDTYSTTPPVSAPHNFTSSLGLQYLYLPRSVGWIYPKSLLSQRLKPWSP